MSEDISAVMREIAKKSKYQTLFLHLKDSGISFFSNTSNFTNLQVLFLDILGAYYNLYSDIALGEVDEIVLDSPVYEDAYFYYKRKMKGKEPTVNKIERETNSMKSFQWIKKIPRK